MADSHAEGAVNQQASATSLVDVEENHGGEDDEKSILNA
jgi:hypothetical protein